jgi:hypothetical protein
MIHALLLAIVSIDPQTAFAGAGIVGMWLRIEHRLTKLETIVEGKKKGKKNESD